MWLHRTAEDPVDRLENISMQTDFFRGHEPEPLELILHTHSDFLQILTVELK